MNAIGRVSLVVSVALTVSGCLSSHPREVANWLLSTETQEVRAAEKPRFGEARLALVSVRSPYDGKSVAVLRADGSVAFDPYNQFAAQPSALVKGVAGDVLRRTGLFARVHPAATAADAPLGLELTVERLALDCREKGARRAVAEVTLIAVERRRVVAAGRGAASVDVADGRFSSAFGAAFAKALVAATDKLAK